MKKCETINDIMEDMLKRHASIREQKAGGHGLVLLRKHDGRRIIVQEMRYFRIFRYEVIDHNILLVENIITGLSHRGGRIQSASSTLYLNDLVQINVYDHTSHFISRAGIDFAYIEEDHSAMIQALQEFIHDASRVVRATWTDKNADEDDLLDAMSFGHRRAFKETYRRNIAIDCGDV